ncbi:glutathione S-transferase [Nitrobacteraceae bacterium AZCC 2146]
MSLTLHFHPLSSFCQKVLTALYENATPFKPQMVELFDPVQRAAFLKLWPIGKFPVLRDEARDRTVPESSIIIDYLAQHYPGPVNLIPSDPEQARRVRARDRFIDLHVHMQVQKIVGDTLRPEGQHDPHGVREARALLQTALGVIDRDIAAAPWAAGETFTMADCAAAPALFYANEVAPFGTTHRNVAAYLQRLMARPSFARVVEEAKPYFHMFPKDKLS